MAINHPTWVAGTAAQRLISVTKLNQLSADAINSTDDIHPQYLPSIYDNRLHTLSIATSAPKYSVHSITSGGIAIHNHFFDGQEGNSQSIELASLKIKCLPSVVLSNVHIGFKGAIGAGTSKYIQYAIDKNSVTVIGVSQEITSVYSSFATYSIDTAVSVAASDILNVTIGIRCIAGINTVESIYCKDIELYLS